MIKARCNIWKLAKFPTQLTPNNLKRTKMSVVVVVTGYLVTGRALRPLGGIPRKTMDSIVRPRSFFVWFVIGRDCPVFPFSIGLGSCSFPNPFGLQFVSSVEVFPCHLVKVQINVVMFYTKAHSITTIYLNWWELLSQNMCIQYLASKNFRDLSFLEKCRLFFSVTVYAIIFDESNQQMEDSARTVSLKRPRIGC